MSQVLFQCDDLSAGLEHALEHLVGADGLPVDGDLVHGVVLHPRDVADPLEFAQTFLGRLVFFLEREDVLDDVTLVCNKSDSQRLKELVDRIGRRFGSEYL